MRRNIAVAHEYFNDKIINQFFLVVLIGGVALQKVGNKFEYVILRELVLPLFFSEKMRLFSIPNSRNAAICRCKFWSFADTRAYAYIICKMLRFF